MANPRADDNRLTAQGAMVFQNHAYRARAGHGQLYRDMGVSGVRFMRARIGGPSVADGENCAR